jgi:ketosteroid isomerase-like protein
MKTWLKDYSGYRGLALSAVAALTVGVCAGWQLHSVSANAQDDATSVAKTEVDRFYRALTDNGPPLADVLGEAFQLIRTDGSRYDRAQYLAQAPKLSDYTLGEFQAMESGDVLTTTFFAGLTGTVEGVARNSVSDPRMAVFSRADGKWKLQAFANLGQGVADHLDEVAKTAVENWAGTVATGDVEAVRKILAPEFQLMRSDGRAYDAEEYLAGGMSMIDSVISVEDVVATGYGDYMVVRYVISLNASAEGEAMQTRAPRLTVFRRSGDGWLVVAHANFAQLEK